jgi:hypothetical protein
MTNRIEVKAKPPNHSSRRSNPLLEASAERGRPSLHTSCVERYRCGNPNHFYVCLYDALACVLAHMPSHIEHHNRNQTKTKRLRLLNTIEIWLILPVVICLFQGLSHACLRITALQESAHGSLHQTQSAAKMLRFTALLDTPAKRRANT